MHLETTGLGPARLRPGIHLPAGEGRPLEPELRAHLEAFFGAPLTGVRLHVGADPLRLGARAYTCGSDVFLAPGRLRPDTRSGLELIGHELAHVLQQRGAPPRLASGNGAPILESPGLEEEAALLGVLAADYVLAARRGDAAPRAAQVGTWTLRAPWSPVIQCTPL